MTIKEIAEICSVGEQTVRDWLRAGTKSVPVAPSIVSAKRKIEKAGHGKAANLTLEETLAIIRAGGRHTLASLLEENARTFHITTRIDRLPNGVQLAELRRIYGAGEAARRIDFLIGYSRREDPASLEYANQAFNKIHEDLRQRRLDFDGGETWKQ
jgi:predicted transcriptional regulator